MKLNKKAKILLIIVPIIVIAILMKLILTTNATPRMGDDVVTRDKTSIILEQTQDPKKVDVYLGMADDSSVASFQIGLNVDVEDNYDVGFSWSEEFTNRVGTAKPEYQDFTISDGSAIGTGKKVKRINIYYVGTKELNELTDDIDVDHIKVGTISLNYVLDENQNPISTQGSTLIVRPLGSDGNPNTNTDEDLVKTVSLSHDVQSVIVEEDDILKTEIPAEGESGGTQGGGNTPGGNQEGNTPGGNQAGDTPGGNQAGDTPSENQTGDTPSENQAGDTPGENQAGDTPGGNQAGDIPGGSQTGDTPGGSQAGDTPSGNQGSWNAGGQNSGNQNNQNTQNNQNQSKNKSLAEKVTTAIKTGANRSNIWAICLLAVLVVIAGIIVFIKVKSKNSKH